MMNIASYFGISTGSAEIEAEAVVASISKYFCISDRQGVKFASPSEKPSQVTDSTHHPSDLTYFNFRSVVSAATVGSGVPDIVLSLKCRFVNLTLSPLP